ncbi:hypothetical protein GCM10009665_75630 [Kitasatospora nipponensis]|uniref:IPT/TIG domain-containing protein n=1 Tax=Kitasatospora nipponensis TaxID=258049 RepID=A0ABN1T7J9_9ACTN
MAVGGNYPFLANSSGNMSVTWTSVGSVAYSGVTQVTLDLPPGITTDGVLMYSTPADYVFTETISPDGRHVTAYFTGTRSPGRSDFMKVNLRSGAAKPSGTVTATVANRGDVNPANDVVAQDVTGVNQAAAVPPAPTVTALSATTGPGTGGTAVTVTGSNLDNGFVLFGDTPATSSSCAGTSCTATAPGGSGSVAVTVVTPGGHADAASAFGYTGPTPPAPPAPVLTSLYTTSGPVAGGTHVNVAGTNLLGGQVLFGGVAGKDSSCGPTFCTVLSPAGTGTVDVTVTTPGGTTALIAGDRFSYTP